MTDFRALCVELTELVTQLTKHCYQPAFLLIRAADLRIRASAALAEEPAVPAPPADGEVEWLVAALSDRSRWMQLTDAQLDRAAQAVLNAYKEARDGQYINGEWIQDEAGQVAAALRAATDQVVPEPSDLDKEMFSISALRLRWVIRDQFLAIATELEGNG